MDFRLTSQQVAAGWLFKIAPPWAGANSMAHVQAPTEADFRSGVRVTASKDERGRQVRAAYVGVTKLWVLRHFVHS
jgi:hypothetical protein